ncbi:clathrin heavy chain linker domain-containing protein 1-like [Mytilus californianus]|uniref:clathrin heavy chain linker domain-containing protein 1-like n=1 Tax=Mytilus californianus TaxID=6549 RepID=UPI0022462436|nr:clathrin heavy chain linker domain-containing protein 1-like [Mytilus californianus]
MAKLHREKTNEDLSTLSRSGTPVNSLPKLPPIITSEIDRTFLLDLNDYIRYETDKLSSGDDDQRYTIYKSVFNRIIEHVSAYKPLLTAIKKEYEDTIEAIKKGQREADFLHGKLKAMASEPSTIRNYRKRADELDERILVIQKDNERLQKELNELQQKRKEREELDREVTEPPKRELKKDSRMIPGLTLEESTDLTLLYRNYEKLDRQLKELNISFRTRYVPKSHKLELKERLDNKVNERDDLLRQGQIYRYKRSKLKIAVEAAQAYNRVKPPHQTVGDAVIFALAQARGLQKQEKELSPGEGQQQRDGSPSAPQTLTTTSFDDDDPSKEKEAEMMLEYIEKFNELFEDGMYEDAAIHAANSPKGILRTSATLAKFRDVKVHGNVRSPLLAFCDAVMASVSAVGSKPNHKLSDECVECVLNENRLDLLAHWIAQDRLSLNHQIGDRIVDHCNCQVPCKCSCQALAQNVYSKLHLYRQAVICMLKQGRVHTGMEYAKHKYPLSKQEYLELLRTCPSLPLMHSLVEEDGEGTRILPLGVVILVLLENSHFDLVIRFMQDLQNTPSADDQNSSLFHSAMMDDVDTTAEQWDSLVKLLQDQGYEETSVKLLSSIHVLSAVKTVLYDSLKVESPENEPAS